MGAVKMRLLLISLISLNLYAGDNNVEIRTKGSSSLIHIDQIGSGNTARVWCGLSEGTYTTHNCSNAEIDIDQNGTGNTARAYSQVANHTGNEYKIDQDGNDNFGYIDASGSADNNDATITQTGSGDHYMKLNFYTDDYNVDATQSGATNKSITVNYNCSTNCNKTVTINQGD